MAGCGVHLNSVAEVEIDPEGTFKYLLVRVQSGPDQSREVVRGSADAECHNNILESLATELEKVGFECKCLGGGKIEHNSKEKKIHVFGLSTEHGKADHNQTVKILKKFYVDYEISCSDEQEEEEC